ncbi:MAG: DUF3352 domain-containing protein [Microcoleaceae cyanobacterium]
MKQQRSWLTILAVGLVALLLVGVGSVYWFGGRSSVKLITGSKSTPTASLFVPENTLMMASLLVNPDQLEAAQQLLGQPGSGSRGQQNEVQRFKDLVLSGTELNYKRDIRPWLGNEVTLALMTMDIDRDPKNGEQAGYLFAATTKDAELSQTKLKEFWQRQQSKGEDIISEQYKGIPLSYRQPQPGQLPQTLSTATFGNRFVLFANSPKVLREAINNVQAPSLSLERSVVYRRALQDLGGGQLGFIFLNLGSWGLNLLPENAVATPQPSLALSLGVNPGGLLAETALFNSEIFSEESIAASLTQPVSLLKYVTSASPLVIAGTDLSHLWSQVETVMATTPQLKILIDQPLAAVQDLSGLDLPQDIFSWVTGEYALALLPRMDRAQPDWMFVTQRSAEAETAIQNLDQMAVEQGYNLGQLQLDENALSVWTRLDSIAEEPSELDPDNKIIKANAVGAHMTLENYEIFATSIEALDNALDATEAGDLLQNAEFKAGLEQLPPENDGYLFLNWQTSRKILKQQIPLLKIVELAAKSIFDHLRAITVTSTGTVEGVKRASAFIQLR